MDYYGPENMRAQYFANMGLAPDGVSPLGPPVPTTTAFAADPASSFGAGAQAAQSMEGAPSQNTYGMQQTRQPSGGVFRGQQIDPASALQGGKQLDFGNRNQVTDGGRDANGPVGTVAWNPGEAPQNTYAPQQPQQMYGDRGRYDPQAVQNPAFTQQQTYDKQMQSSRPAAPQQNPAFTQPSAPPQSQRPSPQPFRSMGPKQSPARSPMSASSTMGGNPANTRPRQPDPAMPPSGQPMRGPRRSTPMGS